MSPDGWFLCVLFLVDHAPKVPKAPLHRTADNPHARAAHSYSIVDDLAQ